MASAVPKSRPRQSMAPTVAPLPQQSPLFSLQHTPPSFQQEQYAFPSPNSQPYDISPASFTFAGSTCCYLNAVVYQQFLDRLNAGLQRSTQEEEKRAVIDAHFEVFENDVRSEIRRLKAELFTSHGLLPSSNKRPPDDDPSSIHSSPDAKRPKPDDDDDDDEVNAKGSWRCLYYENDRESNYHCKGKRYKRVSELRRHIKTHTLPHYCKICGYRTAEERRLQNHKCEPGNKKRYPPVTEEDQLKHEQLARMGIKVGQMRQILFGKKSDSEEDCVADDESVRSEGPSRRESFSDTQQPQEPHHLPPFVPISFPGFVGPILTSQAPHDGVTLSPSAPMYIVPHLPQMPLIQHPQYVVPHGLHRAHPTPPFHPGSVPHSPNVQPGHNQSYYNQEANDFVLYDSNGTATSSSPIHQHSSPPGNYQLAYTMARHSPPYTMYSPPPGMPLPQRQDSLGNYLSEVFPENNGVAAEGATDRAMPSDLIAEMEENLRKQGRTDTKPSIAEKSKKFLRSLSSRSLGKPDGSTSSGAERKLQIGAGQTNSALLGLGTQKKEESGLVASIKKFFSIGMGRKRPSRVEEGKADAVAPSSAPAGIATPAEDVSTATPPAAAASAAERTPAAAITTPAAPTEQPPTVTATAPAAEAITPTVIIPVSIVPMVQATA